MSLSHPNALLLLRKPHSQRSSYSTISASLCPGVKIVTEPNTAVVCFDQSKERIRQLFDKVELSVSSYDTAWVAMVPSPDSSDSPCFPKCVKWLLDNQLHDGSWGLPHHHSLLTKDALSSTLAGVLALKRWGVGEEQINKGLHFIELNFASATDENQHSPIGFDIIFPGMLGYAEDLHLNLPLERRCIDTLLQKRESEIQRAYSEGRSGYLGYVSEGLGKLQDWERVMKYQRKNGSIFNSPSTTAAALIQLQNDGCLNYINSLLEKFGNAVPTIYPLDRYARLCIVDSLERLGIERHFRKEIRSVLAETYRCWLQEEEEIFMDITTRAMAFRLLRLNRYDVSSDPLMQFTKDEHDFNPHGRHLNDIGAALELYKASEIIMHPDESDLERQNLWSSDFLRQKCYCGSIRVDRLNKYISQEVDDALNFPFHASLERAANRRTIEHYNVDSTRILKTSYCFPNVNNEAFMKLAMEDFNICQSIHREELKHIERWVVEKRLDKLKFARQRSAYCYFSAAATLYSPELSDARMSWAKNGVLTTVVDDFFDIAGSIEELENLIQLVEKWDVNVNEDCCSEQVQIIFSALHSTITDIGGKASERQERSVTSHIIEIWLNLLKSMLREAEWLSDKSVPMMDEYMSNAHVSFALGPIVLPTLYLVGPKLSEEVICDSEYRNLFKLMSTCGRLLNDIQGFKRESSEGKLNAVSLRMIHDQEGGVSEEDAVVEIKSFIDAQRRELLRLVLQEEGSIVPRACKDLFWKMSKVVHLFYMKDDGFTSSAMINVVKEIIYEPITLNEF